MRIIFFSQDGEIEDLASRCGAEVSCVSTEEEVVEFLEDVDEDEECLLFLDFDQNKKELEKFNKSIYTNDWITRVIVTKEMSVKELKKHQKGKTAAHGYVLKPLTLKIYKSILSDLRISTTIDEEEIYEEGQDIPSFDSLKESSSGEATATGAQFDVLEDDTDPNVDFENPMEMKVNTQVRSLIDLHSVKGDRPPYEGELNDQIQAKFDSVFSGSSDPLAVFPEEDDGINLLEEVDLREDGAANTPVKEDNISLDLNLDEDEEEDIEINFSDEEESPADSSSSDNANEEIEVQLEEDSEEEDALDFSFSDEEEDGAIDLNESESIEIEEEDEEPEVTLTDMMRADDEDSLEELSADAPEVESEASGEEDSGLDFDLTEEDSEEVGELDFSLDEGTSDSIEMQAPVEEATSEETMDFSQELEDLTQNRQLPTEEELSEFEEETGDIEIPDELGLSAEESPQAESGEDPQSDADESIDDPVLEPEEEIAMSDDSDDILEFDDNEMDEEVEGELSFSTESEEDVEVSEESDEGGLDFNLGEISADETEDEDILSAMSEESGAADGVSSLGGLEAELDETILPDEGDLEEPVVTENSEFDSDDLDFSEDEDEELEKTQAINLSEVAGDLDKEVEADSEDLNSEAFDEDSGSFALDEDEGESAADELEVAAESEDEGESEFDEDSGAFALDANEEESEFDEDSGSFAIADEEEDDEISDIQAIDASAVAADDSQESEDALEEDDLGFDLDDEEGEENTNPTVVMTQEIKQELEDMTDEEVVTQEFRPGIQEETGLMDDVDFGASEIDEEDEGHDDENDDDRTEVTEIAEMPPESEAEPVSSPQVSAESGHLKITDSEDRIPPRFHEGEALRLQATIRQLREEREAFLKEIQDLKKEAKVVEQENLGLKAELDEAKIEISILKKRHTNEVDEMKYRLRITDEKKMYAEEKVKTLQKEFDRLQSKVRVDFNQIKQREKELESQLELAKMDSESQVQSRDKKILELKRKIDQLEFNMENIVIREQKSRDDKVKLEERLDRIMKTLRGSIEVLEEDRE